MLKKFVVDEQSKFFKDRQCLLYYWTRAVQINHFPKELICLIIAFNGGYMSKFSEKFKGDRLSIKNNGLKISKNVNSEWRRGHPMVRMEDHLPLYTTSIWHIDISEILLVIFI